MALSKSAKQLLDVLTSLGESVEFCTAGSLPVVLPGLEVEGVGEVGLPIRPADAKQLIKQAVQAPYGRGEETIVDTDVRRVWQMEPSQFSLRNPAWDTLMSEIVETVRNEFGISQRVRSDLYKLLIYEKGSFFAPHRDTEKADGMFATLVVCLPSRHEGGTLIVTHEDESKRIDFSGKDQYQIQYAAFYADCRHEVKPLARGYRICLVYNLALERRKRQPSAPRQGKQVEEAASRLAKVFENSPLDKIAIPLHHEYTEAGLVRDRLKGADRPLAEVLFRAAEQLGYQAHLALMTYKQSGEVDYSTIDHYGYRWSEPDYSDVEMGEVYEESITLEHWTDPQGRPKKFGEMSLDKDELLLEDGWDDLPVEQEVHEATGNEGVSMDRWYRVGVIVLWPKDRYVRILAREGQASALPALQEMVASQKAPSQSAECRTFADAIIEHWKRPRHWYKEDSQSGKMLGLLTRIADPGLAARFVREVLSKDRLGKEGKALARLCDKVGWKAMAKPLKGFVAAQSPDAPEASLVATASIFADLCTSRGRMTAERKAACQTLAADVVALVEQWDNPQQKMGWSATRESRKGIVESLFRSMPAIDQTDLLERFLAHVLADTKHYDLHEILIPAAESLRKEFGPKSAGRAVYRRLLEHSIEELRSLTPAPPQLPADWAQEVKLRCRCADCRELEQFLRDPEERVHRFRAGKDRRKHLHQQIDNQRLDVDHVTDRRGSPQTLVSTKNRASYERKKKEFAENTRLLARLEKLGKKS